jgi:hypothetical protein
MPRTCDDDDNVEKGNEEENDANKEADFNRQVQKVV